MNSEKAHNRMNALYFTFGALSFIALLSSVWWGGWSFLTASPLNPILTILGIVYIAASVISLRHAFCSPISWMGCSCGGKSHGNPLRSMALLLPIPVFAYFMFGTITKVTFDNSERTFNEVKTELALDSMLFGHVRAEGMTWRFAKRAFQNHYDALGDHLVALLIRSMEARHADPADFEHLMRRHARFHDCQQNCSAEEMFAIECNPKVDTSSGAPTAMSLF